MDQFAENVTQVQCSELEKQEPQELAEDIGESSFSDVIRIEEPVCSNLSGDPRNGPQCSESDAPGDGANDQDCEAPPLAKSGKAVPVTRRTPSEGDKTLKTTGCNLCALSCLL